MLVLVLASHIFRFIMQINKIKNQKKGKFRTSGNNMRQNALHQSFGEIESTPNQGEKKKKKKRGENTRIFFFVSFQGSNSSKTPFLESRIWRKS